MTNAILRGKLNAGNPHVRFDEGEVASYPPTVGRPEGVAMRGAKRGVGLYSTRRKKTLLKLFIVCAVFEAGAVGTVFNAGVALRANVAGAASNPCEVSGGTWSWLDVDVAGGTETLAATPSTATRIAGKGFSSAGGSQP